MDKNTDYYSVLDVLPSADAEVIKAAYRALAKKYHPDSGHYAKAEAERLFRRLNEAYAILNDPDQRKRYDAARSTSQQKSGDFDENAEQSTKDAFTRKEDEAWKIATEFFPDVVKQYDRLLKISPSLAVAFRVEVMKSRSFKSPNEIADKLIDEFSSRYFGKSWALREFGLWCMANKRRDVALEVNKIVTSLGNAVEDDQVIERLVSKHHLKAFGQTLSARKEEQRRKQMEEDSKIIERRRKDGDTIRDSVWMIFAFLAFLALFFIVFLLVVGIHGRSWPA